MSSIRLRLDRTKRDGTARAPNAKDRAAWPVIQEFCPDLGEKQAKHVIAKWLKTSVLVKRDHPDPKSRREQVSLFVGNRPRPQKADHEQLDRTLSTNAEHQARHNVENFGIM